MYSQAKFTAMNPKGQAKVLADLLRQYLLQLGKDWKQAPDEYERYTHWISAPEETYLKGNTPHHRVLDLYIHWREQAGLGPERDVYLQQEPGDRQEPLAPSLPYSVLAHNLRSAYNVGALFRCLDCFGLDSLHLSGYTPGSNHPALRSAARGCEAWVPHKRWEDPLECIAWHKKQQYTVIALETGDDSVSLESATWPERGLLLVGNEELGIAPELLASCDLRVNIPMMGRKASLNVASAFAILSHAISAQKRHL